MARWWIVLVTMTAVALGLVACGDEGGAGGTGTDTGSVEAPSTGAGELAGRISFMRGDPSQPGGGITYIVDPDGSRERRLVPEGRSEFPTWSPDGTEIHIFCCGDGMAAHIFDPDTGEMERALPQPDPSLELYCGGWSPDGSRLSCGGFGVDDPSLNGVYTIRASDGGGLRRITSNPDGEDIAGDFSPDGERLVFARWIDDEPVGFFVTNLNGSGLVRISPADIMIDDSGFAGSWSPDGSQILFVARESDEHHKEIWIAGADGSSPHPFEMTPACGGRFEEASSAGCYSPSWSPDGSMIVFTRSSRDGSTENIYIVSADGTGLRRVTDGGEDDNPDWGVPPDEV
jgi:WD40 repeat protein